MSFIRHRRATSPNKFECRNVYSTNRIDEHYTENNPVEKNTVAGKVAKAKELPDVQFFFAGTGPLEETVNGIKNIKNVGFQKGEALEKLIREARFSIYPSEWYENCPFSVMESLWMTVRFDFELCRFSFYLKL